MFFANLSLVEFFSLLTAAWAAAVALYLLSRSRRRLRVATLRFWQNALQLSLIHISSPRASRNRNSIPQFE